jgi:hypothetical protein
MCDVFVKNVSEDKLRESEKQSRADKIAADKAKYTATKVPGDNYKGFKGNPKV